MEENMNTFQLILLLLVITIVTYHIAYNVGYIRGKSDGFYTGINAKISITNNGTEEE